MKNPLFVLVFFASVLLSCNSDSSKESRYTHSENETVSGYICPMDCEDGKTYEEEGECPVCGMALDEAEEED